MYYREINKKKNTNITSSKEIIDFFQDRGLNFKTLPNFGNYVLKLESKTSGRYHLVRTLNMNKIETPEEYFKEYSKEFPTIFLTTDVLEEIYDAAIFWGIECEPSEFTPEEIVTIIVARLLSIHCSVLYKKDIAPNSNTKYDRSVISYNRKFTKLSLIR